MPGWLVLGVAIAVEWLYWIFTFGQKTPKFLRSHTIRWVISERTFSVEKAKQRLGYKPVNNEDESIKKGVEWCLQQEKKEKVNILLFLLLIFLLTFYPFNFYIPFV